MLSRNSKLLAAMIATLALAACSDAEEEGEESATTASSETSSATETATTASTSTTTTSSDSTTDSSSSTSATVDTGSDTDTESSVSTTYDIDTTDQELDGEYVKSNDYGDGNYTSAAAQCSEGYWVDSIDVEYSTWGIAYYSITWIRLNCVNDAGYTETQEMGDKIYGYTVNRSCQYATYSVTTSSDTSTATATLTTTTEQYGDFMTGLNVIHDNFVKDFRPECGSAVIESDSTVSTGYTFEIVNRTTETGTFTNHLQDNDDDQSIECNGTDRILTGLKGVYRYDSNEAAFTYLQLYCSQVTAAAGT